MYGAFAKKEAPRPASVQQTARASAPTAPRETVPANFVPKPYSPSGPFKPTVPYAPRTTNVGNFVHGGYGAVGSVKDARKALMSKGIIRSPQQKLNVKPRSPMAPQFQQQRQSIVNNNNAATSLTLKEIIVVKDDTPLLKRVDPNATIAELNQQQDKVADLTDGVANPNDAILVKREPGIAHPTEVDRAELDRHDRSDRARMLRVACIHDGLAETLAYYYDKRPVPVSAGITLHPYQVLALNWMTLREKNPVHGISGGILGFEPGLGKTITASLHVLWSARPKEGPTLIIASLNVLKEWRKHFTKFYDMKELDKRIVYLHPEFNSNTATTRAADIRDADIVLTTYDMMIASYRHLVYGHPDEADACIEYVNEEKHKKIAALHVRKLEDVNVDDKKVRGVHLIHRGVRWGRLMLDESQRIANPSSKGFRAAMAIAAPLRWGITGTIVRNYVHDVWSQMRVVGYNRIKSKRDWTRAAAPRYYANHQLNSVIYGLTYEQAGITLPPFTEETIRVTLTPRERAIYDMAERKARAIYLESASRKLAASTALAMITRLRRLTVAPTLLDTNGAISGDGIEDFDDALDALFRSDLNGGTRAEENDYRRDNVMSLDSSDSGDSDDENEDDDDDEKNIKRGTKRTHESPDDDNGHIAIKRNRVGNADDWRSQKSPTPLSIDGNGKKHARDTIDDEDAEDVAPNPFASSAEALDFCVNVEGEGGIGASKIKAILGVIERHLMRGPEHKITCFSMWSSALALVLKAASHHPTLCDVQSVQVDGSLKGEERDSLLEIFRTDPNVRILAIQGKVGGEGLNLQHASGGIAIEPHWTRQAKKQQRRRFWRIGQDKPTWWYDIIVENTIEGRVLEICDEKDKIEEEFKTKRRHGRAAPSDIKDVQGKLLGVIPTGASSHYH